MNDQQRFALFLAACIPARFSIAYVAHRFPHPTFRLLALFVACRWLGSFPTRGFFGGVAWWGRLRPLHAFMFLGYAVSGSAVWLGADAVLGLVAGLTR